MKQLLLPTTPSNIARQSDEPSVGNPLNRFLICSYFSIFSLPHSRRQKEWSCYRRARINSGKGHWYLRPMPFNRGSNVIYLLLIDNWDGPRIRSIEWLRADTRLSCCMLHFPVTRRWRSGNVFMRRVTWSRAGVRMWRDSDEGGHSGTLSLVGTATPKMRNLTDWRTNRQRDV